MLDLNSSHGYHAYVVGWDPDPELLRTFLAVARHRNFTRAAEALYVTQPAVSRRVARLERQLGLPLLERLGKAIHLTEAGEALAREATGLLGEVERLAESVRARRSGERGRLRIGASTTPGLYLLPPVLVAYRAAHPEVEVRYEVENSLRIEEKLVRNDLDLGFVGARLAHPSLRLRPLVQDEIVLYASASHRLATRRSVAPRDLEGETCLVREPGSATRKLVEAWARRARVRFERTTEIHCPEAAKVLVRAGVGVSYLSVHGLRGEAGAGLARLAIRGWRVSRPVYVAVHGGKRVSPPMLAFLRLADARARGARGQVANVTR